jgi:hypothetical protein
MITIKTLMDIEEIILKADNDLRFTYSLDELIKSETYIKEIGDITNVFLGVQIEYSKIIDEKDEQYKQKLVDYHNKLISDKLYIDITKYLQFIKQIESKIFDKEYYEKAKKILAMA